MKNKDKEILLSIFKMNPCIETYTPLYNIGIKMVEIYSNNWHDVTTWKSDFSDINVGGFTYATANINDINGVWVTRK